MPKRGEVRGGKKGNEPETGDSTRSLTCDSHIMHLGTSWLRALARGLVVAGKKEDQAIPSGMQQIGT